MRIAVAALACALGAPGLARGAAALDNFRQGSHAGTSSLAIGFTVGAGADRLLIVAVSTARSDVTVTGVSWRGMNGTRVAAQNVDQGSRDCRTELWRVLDPASGQGQVAVNLSGSSAMGMGMVSYTGVDQQSPTGAPVMTSGSTSPVRVAVTVTGVRPILGAACLGGAWGLMNGPDAVAENNDVNLWDFTEQNVVGLGNQQVMFSGGSAAISWNVAFSDPFAWGAVGLSITPAGSPPPPPPDAAPDLARDVAPDRAPDLRLPADLAVLPVDLAPPADAGVPADTGVPADAEESSPTIDAEEGTVEADAEEPFDSALADSAPDPDDTGNTIRGVDLQVGCACRVGGRPSLPWFLLVPLALALRRRRG